jgi:hypothetical protein
MAIAAVNIGAVSLKVLELLCGFGVLLVCLPYGNTKRC